VPHRFTQFSEAWGSGLSHCGCRTLCARFNKRVRFFNESRAQAMRYPQLLPAKAEYEKAIAPSHFPRARTCTTTGLPSTRPLNDFSMRLAVSAGVALTRPK